MFLALILAGCAALRPPTLEPGTHYLSWQKRQQQLMQMQDWSVAGKMGITYAGNTDIVNFNWQQNSKKYTLDLSGPMHIGSAQIVGEPNQVTLYKGNNTQPITTASPENLVQQEFGWSLPVSNMVYWVRALPAGKSKKTIQVDVFSHLIQLKQSGWQLNYADFRSTHGIDLPTKIYMANGDLRIKVIIDSWDVTKSQ